MSDQEKLVKIHVDLPHHWGTNRETFWAHQKGEDLYQIRNVPFFAYGLNFLDIVRTFPAATAGELFISSLDRPSGHQTLRVIFSPETPPAAREPILRRLEQMGVATERYNESAYSVDIPVQLNFDAVFDFLEDFEEKEILSFEGNEQRTEGSFDDLPTTDS